MFDTESYIIFGAVFVHVIAIVYVIYRGRRGRVARGNEDLPRCAKCRYALVNLPSGTCPECGSEVATGGVIPPGESGYPSFGNIVLWLLFCGALVFASSYSPWELRRYAAWSYLQSELYHQSLSTPSGPSFLVCNLWIEVEGQTTQIVRKFPYDFTVQKADATLSFNRYDISIEAIADPPRYRLKGETTWRPFIAADIFARCEPLLPIRGSAQQQDALNQTIKELGDAINTPTMRKLPPGYNWKGNSSSPFIYAPTLVYILVIPLWTFGMLWLLPRAKSIIRGEKAHLLIAPPPPVTSDN